MIENNLLQVKINSENEDVKFSHIKFQLYSIFSRLNYFP